MPIWSNRFKQAMKQRTSLCLVVLTAFLSVALLALPAQASEPVPPAGLRSLTVMTRNLYLGADLNPLFTTPPQEVPAKVAELWEIIKANDFPARAKALAAEIDEKEPALIGLQEAVLYRIQSPGDFLTGNTPATEVAYDYVALLLAELAARGLHYTVVVESVGYDVEAPSATGDDIRLTDREVILARTDLKTADLKLTNPQAGRFASNLVAPFGGGTITLYRGWAAVDGKVRGRSFRFVTTHLEPIHPVVQVNQANELLQGPGNTDLPLIFVGDFNSKADGTGTSTYSNFIDAGFQDAWVLAGEGPGLTCCFAQNLHDTSSSLTSRIDLVLLRGQVQVDEVDVVGEAPADHGVAGLWPSDHAGVVSVLILP